MESEDLLINTSFSILKLNMMLDYAFQGGMDKYFSQKIDHLLLEYWPTFNNQKGGWINIFLRELIVHFEYHDPQLLTASCTSGGK